MSVHVLVCAGNTVGDFTRQIILNSNLTRAGIEREKRREARNNSWEMLPCSRDTHTNPVRFICCSLHYRHLTLLTPCFSLCPGRTRMRLQVQEGAQVEDYDTCAQFNFGATKDYSIDVIGEHVHMCLGREAKRDNERDQTQRKREKQRKRK